MYETFEMAGALCSRCDPPYKTLQVPGLESMSAATPANRWILTQEVRPSLSDWLMKAASRSLFTVLLSSGHARTCMCLPIRSARTAGAWSAITKRRQAW